MSPKIVGFVQARMSSTRLPGKVMREIYGGHSMVWHAYHRLRAATLLTDCAILTSTNPADDPIAAMAEKENIPCVRGDEADLLNRFYKGATVFKADAIIRITSDCPLVDPDLVDDVIRYYLDHPGQIDYISNARPVCTYPHGLDVEIFTFQALERAWKEVTDPFRREWLTTNFFEHPEQYRLYNQKGAENFSRYRLTVDYAEDLELMQEIFKALYPKNPLFRWRETVAFLDQHPELLKLNAAYHRDDSYIQELQKRGIQK